MAVFVCAGLIATLASRLHEITSAAAVIRPALTLSIIAAFVLFPKVPRARLQEAWRNPRFLSVFRYCAWAVLMIPFAVWRGGAVDTISGAFVPVFILLTAMLLISPREESLDFLQKAFVLSAAAHIVLLKLMGGGWRLTSMGSLDPNDLASLAAITTPLAIGLAQRARNVRDRVIFSGAALLLIAGVIWTSSRGGTLALLCGLLAFLALLPRQRRGTILLFVLVAVPVFWFTASERYRQRIINISNYEEDYNTTDFWGRKQIWQRARIYIRRNPIAGVGVRGFETYDGLYMKEIGKTGKWSAPHNAYVQATAETGIPGGILFVVLLLGAGKVALQLARKKTRGHLSAPRSDYISALAAFAAGAYFLSHAYSVQLFTLIGLIALADVIRRQGGAGPPALMSPHVPLPLPPGRGWRSARTAAYGAQSIVGYGKPVTRTMERPA